MLDKVLKVHPLEVLAGRICEHEALEPVLHCFGEVLQSLRPRLDDILQLRLLVVEVDVGEVNLLDLARVVPFDLEIRLAGDLPDGILGADPVDVCAGKWILWPAEDGLENERYNRGKNCNRAKDRAKGEY